MSKVDIEPGAPPPGDEKLTMGIDPYEKNWIRVSVLLLVAFAALVAIAGFAMGFQVPGVNDEVDPGRSPRPPRGTSRACARSVTTSTRPTSSPRRGTSRLASSPCPSGPR
ncbi:MAG: hypothetical protein R2715_13805 [Ilumatobacteraceae bacterium]